MADTHIPCLPAHTRLLSAQVAQVGRRLAQGERVGRIQSLDHSPLLVAVAVAVGTVDSIKVRQLVGAAVVEVIQMVGHRLRARLELPDRVMLAARVPALPPMHTAAAAEEELEVWVPMGLLP